MAGLTQTSASMEPNYFLGFLSSRTFCRIKELKSLSLSRRSWRIQVKLEENGSQSSMGIRAVSSGAGGLEDKTSPPEKEKDPSRSSKSSGKFEHPMWKNGTWDIQGFTKDGKVDWNAVIDAEARRRKWLEDNPEASSNDEPVIFHTSVIPWWAWVIRFHLPEAELLNGRAAMIGFSMAYVIDSLTGVGLVDQMNSVFGKLLLLITVAGVLLIRKTDDVAKLRQLFKEWNAYDKQWQATWKEEVPETSEEE